MQKSCLGEVLSELGFAGFLDVLIKETINGTLPMLPRRFFHAIENENNVGCFFSIFYV